MLGLGVNISRAVAPSSGGQRVLIASYDFNDDTGGNTSQQQSTTFPTGWAKADSGNFTLFGSTTDFDLSGNQNLRGWMFGFSQTGSGSTGPIGGHAGGSDTLDSVITSGVSDNSSSHRYLFNECSTPMNPGTSSDPRATIIRTGELDFSSYSSIEMTFWFHCFGESFGSGGGFGIAATTSATSASSAVEAGSGLGFTSYTAGGATMNFTDLSSTSKSLVRIGSEGQVQTDGGSGTDGVNNRWIKATVDLSAAAGESSVYIHFAGIANPALNGFKQDFGVDSIAIIGTT